MKSKQRGEAHKTQQQSLLLNIARSIGSTLGALAAKGGAPNPPATRPIRTKKTGTKAANNKKRMRSSA